MATTISGWTTLAENPAVLVREYAFSGGRTNAMAVALPDRKWLFISPPSDLTAEEARAFSEHGEVVALLEHNGSHHMGLGPCRALFPNAVSYAEPAAAARIRKKSKDYGQLAPIDGLKALLGDKVSMVPIAGCKIGDVLVRARTDNGTVLYAGDFIANIQHLPNAFSRLLFKIFDSGPGLKVFRMFYKFFVADRIAARDDLIRELEANPPAIVVPGHGDVVTRAELGPTLVTMLRAAVTS